MILDIQRHAAAAWLWMNRPQARNALSDEQIAALETALDVLEKDAATRVLVLAGRGTAFCAGGDLAKMEKAAKMTRARSRREASRFAKLLLRLHAFPKPVVARVHGPAFAGGMGLAAACDLVVASEEAEFALPETRLGLVPAMISPYLVRAMGAAQARRYMLTGERLSAPEAKRIGFAHECVVAAELDAVVGKMCERLALAGPEALARAKKLLLHVEGAPLTSQLAAETAAALADARASPEAREGMRSFLEKRKPSWQ
ncbi:MAG: enoyl-CoA hydratase-related protein [Burkholderiales bacterium]